MAFENLGPKLDQLFNAGPVIEGVGPNNARAYSQMLSGGGQPQGGLTQDQGDQLVQAVESTADAAEGASKAAQAAAAAAKGTGGPTGAGIPTPPPMAPAWPSPPPAPPGWGGGQAGGGPPQPPPPPGGGPPAPGGGGAGGQPGGGLGKTLGIDKLVGALGKLHPLLGKVASGIVDAIGKIYPSKSRWEAEPVGRAWGAAMEKVPVVKFADAMLKAVERVKDFNEEMLEAKRHLAGVSPSMAAVMAESDIKKLIRDFRRGEAEAESTRELANAQNRLADALQPIESAMTNLWNKVETVITNALAAVVEALGALGEKLRLVEPPKDVGVAGPIGDVLGGLLRGDDEWKNFPVAPREAKRDGDGRQPKAAKP